MEYLKYLFDVIIHHHQSNIWLVDVIIDQHKIQ